MLNIRDFMSVICLQNLYPNFADQPEDEAFEETVLGKLLFSCKRDD